MICKVDVVLRTSSKEELQKSSSKYKKHITNIDFKNESESYPGCFSSLADLFLKYLGFDEPV